MLSEPTIDKLKELGLYGLADAFLEQQKNQDVQRLSFDERFAFLVDAEWMLRHNKRLSRRLKEAKLRIGAACLEDVDAGPARGIDKGNIHKLATCAYVVEKTNVIITGATGTGKTFLACALAQQACRRGFRALYRRASRLYDELSLAKADGSYARLLQKLARIDVLVVDDFALSPMREQDRSAFLDVLEEREGNRSTILSSQLPSNLWHDYIHDPMVADAVCDRIIHSAHKLELTGPSRRKEKTTNT